MMVSKIICSLKALRKILGRRGNIIRSVIMEPVKQLENEEGAKKASES